MGAYRWSRLIDVLIVSASACSAERVRSPAPSPFAAGSGSSARTVAAAAPSPSPLNAFEIEPALEKTTSGFAVEAIGWPRLRATPSCCGKLVVRLNANKVFALDDVDVKQWDLSTGKWVARDSVPASKFPLVSFFVSSDGTWVARGDEHIDLIHEGVRSATTKSGRALGFTTTNQLLLQDRFELQIVDPTTATITQRLPKQPFGVGGVTLDAAADDTQLWWLSRKGYARWDKDRGTFSAVTAAAKDWRVGRIALHAPIAIVEQDKMLYRLDLSSGALTKVTKPSIEFAISPSGAWVALLDYKGVRIVDTATGAMIAKLATTAPITTVAFSEEDRTFAFVEDGVIHIADIANNSITLRPLESPSRFLGWQADGLASIEHDGKTQTFDVTKMTLGPSSGGVQSAPTSPLSLTFTDRTLTATLNNKEVAKLDVGDPPRPAKGLEQSYWKAVPSPTGKTFAVWVRRPDVAPEPEPTLGDNGDRDPRCDLDPHKYQTCLQAYIMELWSLDGAPKLLWRERPDGKRERRGRTWPYSKEASGPITFTPDGKFVLFGFVDGDVIIRATDASAINRIESLHHAPITRIEVAPGGKWVFTEDLEGEQRIWPL